MNNGATTEDQKPAVGVPRLVRCGRCDSPVDGQNWENGWPNYGKIELGFAAQAFGALCGMQHIAEPEHFDVWHEGHPAMTTDGAQEVCFEWKPGETDYRLCYYCQKELLRRVGEFFGFPQRAKEISEANA